MFIDFSKIKLEQISNSEAKEFMKKYHYTKTCAKATISLGFYYKNKLCTMIVYGQPSGKYLAKSIWEGGTEKECLELLRLFSFDWCSKNIESYCISKSIKWLKQNHPEIKILVSYADTSVGHVGYIYQASNWLYIGNSGAEREIYIDNIRQHRRDLYDKYGTSSIPKLKEKFGNRLKVSNNKFVKNKYIYVLGNSKKEHKKLMDLLKIKPIKEYPKGNLKYYNNEAT
jgi:hypothetical protein